MRQIADPEMRKQYSEMILKMRNNDEKAIEFIEHALEGIMEPEFTARKEMTVLGLMEHFASENEDHEGIWKRYMAYHDKISSSSVDGAHYGVYFDTEIGVDYLAGMSVGGVEEAPEGLTLRDVPLLIALCLAAPQRLSAKRMTKSSGTGFRRPNVSMILRYQSLNAIRPIPEQVMVLCLYISRFVRSCRA